METIKVYVKLKPRKETRYIAKAREMYRIEQEVQSRQKHDGLYDLDVLAMELGLKEPDYEWNKLQEEIHHFKDCQYLERLHYWHNTEEGKQRLQEIQKPFEKIEYPNAFGNLS